MSSKFVAVNIPTPGGFGTPAGGGPPDPRKPGDHKPGHDHYEEEASPPAISKALRKALKKARKEQSRLARASKEVQQDSEMDDAEPEASSSAARVGIAVESGDDDLKIISGTRNTWGTVFGVALPSNITNKQLARLTGWPCLRPLIFCNNIVLPQTLRKLAQEGYCSS